MLMQHGMADLPRACYGKDNVRLCKVHRHADKTQSVTEMTVSTMLEGDMAASWTQCDNSGIVATDTQKQTIYIKARQHPVNPPELFAAILAQHFLDEYPWMTRASVGVTVHRWTRLTVDGKPHPHSFLRDGSETRQVEAVAIRGEGIRIRSGIKGLLVLKSTGSQFWGFHRDAYTRLSETRDRMLSSEIEATWSWPDFADVDGVRSEQDSFDRAWSRARSITLDTFAKEDSPSVQNTMYIMGEKILAALPRVTSVEFSLPNKHYFEIGEGHAHRIIDEKDKTRADDFADLSWFDGLKNTGADAEVFAPQTDPNGLIQCTIARSSASPTPSGGTDR